MQEDSRWIWSGLSGEVVPMPTLAPAMVRIGLFTFEMVKMLVSDWLRVSGQE
jgi:hypothetical protein